MNDLRLDVDCADVCGYAAIQVETFSVDISSLHGSGARVLWENIRSSVVNRAYTGALLVDSAPWPFGVRGGG